LILSQLKMLALPTLTTAPGQRARLKNSPYQANSEMKNKDIKEFCKLNDASIDLLRQAVTQMHLSARGYHRILKLSRTIADLGGCDDIGTEHVAEALQYRAKAE